MEYFRQLEVNEILRENVEQNRWDEVLKAIEQGADINSGNKVNGMTALHWASLRNHVAIAHFLCNAGARIDIERSDGKLPVDLAHSSEMLKVFDSNAMEWTGPVAGDSFVANYRRYPIFPYGSDTTAMVQQQHHRTSAPEELPTEATTIVKLLVNASTDDMEYVEIELRNDEKTYQLLCDAVSRELGEFKEHIVKIIKLPDVLLRSDQHVARLRDGDRIKVVWG